MAFESWADNLVLGDTNGYQDIFVHDRQTGVTERVSVDSFGMQGNHTSTNPCISTDGRFVVFESSADNLVAGDTNNSLDIFVHDRQARATERNSVDSLGVQGNYDSLNPSISEDGRYLAFDSHSDNLVPGDTNWRRDIFVHDRQTRVTERVSIDSLGAEGNQHSSQPNRGTQDHAYVSPAAAFEPFPFLFSATASPAHIHATSACKVDESLACGQPPLLFPVSVSCT